MLGIIACEESQRVCKAFRDRGHEVYSCDIISCSGGHPEWHLQGDVLNYLNGLAFCPDCKNAMYIDDNSAWCDDCGKLYPLSYLTEYRKWDFMIAHPPCTYLCLSGARWLPNNPQRQKDMLDACEFFNKLLNCDIPKIAIENPLHHKEARKHIRHYDQLIQPLYFGETARKTTCLWLKNLPPLMFGLTMPEAKVKSGSGREWGKWFWDTSCSPYANGERSKERSKTFQGIANAFAEQWGNL